MEELRKKIIYVDDVNFSLLSLKSRLGRRYEIYPAQSAATLFDILEHVGADLILLDINMPEQDGFEIIKAIKADARFADLPVIFLTGKKDKSTFTKAMGLGAADLVTKPFSDEELVLRIENQLGAQRQESFRPVLLAVDDNPSILKELNELLHEQYRVYTLPKPEAMKMLLDKIKPDLFLLDCQMPIQNGFDLARQIREIPDHEKTPIIFLTSDGTLDTLNAAVIAGADDFIVKPIDEAVLREKLAVHTLDYMIRRQMRKLAEL